MRHVISIHDVVSDTMHQFAPTYHDYVLYSNGGGKEAPPKTARAPAPECPGAMRACGVRGKQLILLCLTVLQRSLRSAFRERALHCQSAARLRCCASHC